MGEYPAGIEGDAAREYWEQLLAFHERERLRILRWVDEQLNRESPSST